MASLPHQSPALLLTPSSLWSSRSAAAFSFARCSASASASGESGIVSNDEMLGERERSDVGVEGIDDEDTEYSEG